MTDAERKIWNIIRRRQIENIQFFRQRPVGPYIVDFISLSHKVIIEIDGGQHLTEENTGKDKIRDSYMQKIGFVVFRYTDTQILKEIDAVKNDLYEKIKSLPTSLFQREEAIS